MSFSCGRNRSSKPATNTAPVRLAIDVDRWRRNQTRETWGQSGRSHPASVSGPVPPLRQPPVPCSSASTANSASSAALSSPPPGISSPHQLANSLIPNLISAQDILSQVCRLFLRNRYPYIRVKEENLLSKDRAAQRQAFASRSLRSPSFFRGEFAAGTGTKPNKAPLSR